MEKHTEERKTSSEDGFTSVLSGETWESVGDIAEIYGVTKKTIWDWSRDGKFPRPVKFGPQTTRWRRSDRLTWEEAKAAETEGAQ